MKKLIHTAIQKALTEHPERRVDSYLWVSDLGQNPYGACRRLMTGELESFDYPTQLKMDAGNALEAFSLRQVAENLGQPIQTQFPLWNDIWSGYADLVIGHGSEDVIIYDHKGSAGRWWDYNDSLPRSSHCCQVWMYGQLYYERYGIKPRLGLYYRGWGAWAEFEIIEKDGYLRADGFITNEKGETETEVSRTRLVNPSLLRREIESLYKVIMTGEMTGIDLEIMNPNEPDWDYAENATERLLATLPEATK